LLQRKISPKKSKSILAALNPIACMVIGKPLNHDWINFNSVHGSSYVHSRTISFRESTTATSFCCKFSI